MPNLTSSTTWGCGWTPVLTPVKMDVKRQPASFQAWPRLSRNSRTYEYAGYHQVSPSKYATQLFYILRCVNHGSASTRTPSYHHFPVHPQNPVSLPSQVHIIPSPIPSFASFFIPNNKHKIFILQRDLKHKQPNSNTNQTKPNHQLLLTNNITKNDTPHHHRSPPPLPPLPLPPHTPLHRPRPPRTQFTLRPQRAHRRPTHSRHGSARRTRARRHHHWAPHHGRSPH